MQKQHLNILVAGFDNDSQTKIVKLLNDSSENNSIEFNIDTATNSEDILKNISDNFYKICLLNSELKAHVNHKVIDDIHNKLCIQNKNTAIINIDTNPETQDCNCDNSNCFQIHKFNHLCIDDVKFAQLNEYWIVFLIKLATQNLLLQKEVKRLSHYDSLTGLINRNLYLNHLNHAMALAEREKRFCTLIYLDINNFKRINEEFGFKLGDTILIDTAQRIKKSIRSTDIAARLGSDEFAILLENCHPMEAARIISDLKQAMAYPYNLGHKKINVEFSIDNASYPDDCTDKTSFLNDVRQAHYLAKSV